MSRTPRPYQKSDGTGAEPHATHPTRQDEKVTDGGSRLRPAPRLRASPDPLAARVTGGADEGRKSRRNSLHVSAAERASRAHDSFFFFSAQRSAPLERAAERRRRPAESRKSARRTELGRRAPETSAARPPGL